MEALPALPIRKVGKARPALHHSPTQGKPLRHTVTLSASQTNQSLIRSETLQLIRQRQLCGFDWILTELGDWCARGGYWEGEEKAGVWQVES